MLFLSESLIKGCTQRNLIPIPVLYVLFSRSLLVTRFFISFFFFFKVKISILTSRLFLHRYILMLVTVYADPGNFSTPIIKDLPQSVIIAAWHAICVNVPYYSASALMMGVSLSTVFAVRNNTLNDLVHLCLLFVMILSEWILGSGTAKSKSKCRCNFVTYCQIPLCESCSVLYPHQQHMRLLAFLQLCQQNILSNVWAFCQSDG